MKIVETAIIEEKLTKELENAWYSYQAILELIKSGIGDEIVFSKYERSYANYNKIWSKILLENFKTDYTKTGIHNWECNFNTNTITITE